MFSNAMRNSIRFEVVIPKYYDASFGEKEKIPNEVIKQVCDELIEIFGGMTQIDSVTGHWIDWSSGPKDFVTEDSNYIITLDVKKQLALSKYIVLLGSVQNWCKLLKQKAIHITMFECNSINIDGDKPFMEDTENGVIINKPKYDYIFAIDGRVVAHGPQGPEMEAVEIKDMDKIYSCDMEMVKKYALDTVDIDGPNVSEP